jgi:thermostable 8-oxoguanine DNA glycosylase
MRKITGSKLWVMCAELDFLDIEPSSSGIKSPIFKLSGTEYFVLVSVEPLGLYWFQREEDFDDQGRLCITTNKYVELESIIDEFSEELKEDIIFNMDIFSFSLPPKEDTVRTSAHNTMRAFRELSKSLENLNDKLSELYKVTDRVTVLPGGKSIQYESSIRIKLSDPYKVKRKTLWERFKEGIKFLRNKTTEFFAYLQESW